MSRKSKRKPAPAPAPPSGRPRQWRQWLEAHELLVRYAKNIGVAVAIELLIVIIGPLFNLPRLEDNTLDFAMRRFSNTNWSQQRPASAVFAFLDVDDETYQRWNTPVTPRGKLKRIIDYAARGGAKTIVVDFDLNRSYADLGARLAQSDDELEEYLASYDESHPPLILVRRLSVSSSGQRCPEPRASFLDSHVHERRNVFWGTVGIDQDDDAIERRWGVVGAGCTPGGATVLPSVQLIATALALGGDEKLEESEKWVQQFAPADCAVCAPPPGGMRHRLARLLSAHPVHRFDLEEGIELESGGEDLTQRIVFRIPFLRSEDRDRYLDVRLKDGSRNSIVTVVPAWQVTEAQSGRELAGDLVKGRIVVIGASYPDSGDLHATPLGNMPGAMVLLNSIYSLMQYGQLRDHPEWAELALLAASIFGVTWLFTRYHHFTGMIWSSVGVFAIASGMSLYLFRQGRWLDFVMPLLAVQVHHFYESFHEYRHARH